MTTTLTPSARAAAWRAAERADHPCCWCGTDTGRIVPVQAKRRPTGHHICGGCAERLLAAMPGCNHEGEVTS